VITGKGEREARAFSSVSRSLSSAGWPIYSGETSGRKINFRRVSSCGKM